MAVRVSDSRSSRCSPALWWYRTRSRAPLAAVLFFAGTLFPALGFVNVYPFIYSFVADHFQYLASLGIIVLASAAAATLAARWLTIVSVAVVVPLALLATNQSRQYADAETLYRTTLSRNPACWMAYINLGKLRQEEARAQGDDPRLLGEAARISVRRCGSSPASRRRTTTSGPCC